MMHFLAILEHLRAFLLIYLEKPWGIYEFNDT
jgi:hypothetical protein